MNFIVCRIDSLMETINKKKPTHVLSVIEKDWKIDLSMCWSVENHKVINFQDITDSKHPECPSIDHCKEVLDWGNSLPKDATILTHCYAGISRSTASTLALMYQYVDAKAKSEGLTDLTNDVILNDVAARLVSIRPIAFPNILMSQYYDELLGLNGKFLKTAKYIRNNSPFLLDNINRDPDE